MTKEFCILLTMLLLTGFGTAVVISVHDDNTSKNPYDDVQHTVLLELRSKALRFFHQKDLFESENHLRKLLKINPDNREMQLLYGRILLETGRNDEAERIFRRMASSYPLDCGARNNLGVSLLLRHQYEAALREFETAVRNETGKQYVPVNLEVVRSALKLSRENKKFIISLNAGKISGRNVGVITTTLTELQEKESK